MVNLNGFAANSSTVALKAEKSQEHQTTEPIGPSLLKVLLVDDNKEVAQITGMLLMASGYDVRTVHDGPSALEVAPEYRPHVVLLDIGLPGISGYEVARRIRQQTIGKNVVLVAVTGYSEESDRQLAREAGFDHHLAKPTDIHKLEQILATVSKRTFQNVESTVIV